MDIQTSDKTLGKHPETVKLLEDDPLEHALERPTYIRIDAWEYEFHRPKKGEQSALYWNRTFCHRVYPTQGVATMADLKE